MLYNKYINILINNQLIRSMSKSAMTVSVRSMNRKRPLIPQRAPITLTPEAVERVRILMKQKPDMDGLLIGLRTRGCNGQSYTMQYVLDGVKDADKISQDGVNIYIDRKAIMSLIGTIMDYETSRLCSEFVFNNPNIDGTCGCGESFNIAPTPNTTTNETKI